MSGWVGPAALGALLALVVVASLWLGRDDDPNG